MGQAEGPEAQVGRRVGDAAQAVLDGVDGLVHHGVPKVKLQREQRMRAAGSTAQARQGHGQGDCCYHQGHCV